MPRHHTIWDAERQEQIDVEFTAAEEAAQDIADAEDAVRISNRALLASRQTELTARLEDDSITDSELRELLRLERGL